MDDAGQGVVLGGGGDLHLQGAGGVDRAREDRLPGARLHRHGLTGDRGGVQRGVPGADDPVGGEALSRPDDHAVPDSQIAGGDDDVAAVPPDGGLAGDEVEEGAQALAGPGDGVLLQALAEGVQEGQGGGLLHLTQQGGAEGPDGHEEVHAQPTLDELPHGRGDEGDAPGDERGSAQRERGALLPGAAEQEARQEQGPGEHAEADLGDLPEVVDVTVIVIVIGPRRHGCAGLPDAGVLGRAHGLVEEILVRAYQVMLFVHVSLPSVSWVLRSSGAGWPAVPIP